MKKKLIIVGVIAGVLWGMIQLDLIGWWERHDPYGFTKINRLSGHVYTMDGHKVYLKR